MPTKNHSKSMSQSERGFWREVFVALMAVPGMTITMAAEVCDAAVAEYRKRITWRSHD